MTVHDNGLTHIADPLSDVLKEIQRRADLRPRLEAEQGQSLTDDEFIAIAEQTGVMI